jgi:hypothetical protein
MITVIAAKTTELPAVPTASGIESAGCETAGWIPV